jgi:hypothetical protein
MTTFTLRCSICKKPTPHYSTGTHLSEAEPDGQVFQRTQCAECKTVMKVYYKPDTNEFQQNVDAPDDTDA